ncbi:MAG: diacylglycerol kinase [Neorhizobium sp.]|jgi:diacylglycerol kinase (ATP)|nr:diacylglycerol kinase [Neorhizobium sp.]
MTEVTETAAPEKIKGIAHVFAAASYSAAGARRLWREAAFRHEILAFFALAALHFAVGSSLPVLCGALVLFLSLVAVEALNTAIEEIVDRISPEVSATGKHAKDLGSFAVGLMLLANGVLAAYALLLWFGA